MSSTLDRLIAVCKTDRQRELARAYVEHGSATAAASANGWHLPNTHRDIKKLLVKAGLSANQSRKTIPGKVRLRVLERCGYRCSYCGAEAAQKALHIDHIKPLSEGGTNEESNYTAACADCNQAKNATILETVPEQVETIAAELAKPLEVVRVDTRELGPWKVKIEFCKGMSDHGEWDPETRTIRISIDKTRDEQAATLAHEAIHAISDTYGLELTESQTLTLENGLAQMGIV